MGARLFFCGRERSKGRPAARYEHMLVEHRSAISQEPQRRLLCRGLEVVPPTDAVPAAVSAAMASNCLRCSAFYGTGGSAHGLVDQFSQGGDFVGV